jgi:hypothetical protein
MDRLRFFIYVNYIHVTIESRTSLLTQNLPLLLLLIQPYQIQLDHSKSVSFYGYNIAVNPVWVRICQIYMIINLKKIRKKGLRLTCYYLLTENSFFTLCSFMSFFGFLAILVGKCANSAR